MAKILEFLSHKDEWIEERYELVRERMDGVAEEDKTGLFCQEYLGGMALFLHDALRVYDLKAAQMLDDLPLEKQKGIHDQLYGAPVWEQYGTLSDACWAAGEEWGPLLWAAGQEWKLAAAYACSGQCFLLTVGVELFLQVYQLFQMEQNHEMNRDELKEAVRQALYYHFSDYCDVTSALVYHEQFYPGEFHHQLLEAVEEDQYGLYRLGGYVDEGAEARCALLSSTADTDLAYKKELVEHIVDSLQQTDGPRKAIAMYVPVGYEQLAQALYHPLTESGFQVTCLRRQETFMARIAEFRDISELPELPLFWDRGLKERRLTEEKNALDVYKEHCQERLTVLDLENMGIYGMKVQVVKTVDTESDGESTIRLTLTPKQERLYAEFQDELRALRAVVWPEE